MRWDVPVKGGEVPVLADDDAGNGGKPVVILAHGAGSHMEQKTVVWLAGLLREAGFSVVRFNFLYRAQGRGMPDRMPVAVETYRAVIASVRDRLKPGRLLIGGHSFGGRVASIVEAEGKSVDGLVLFGYPLHPPGQPEKLRDAHLSAIETPTLQLNGTADELCTRAIMDQIVASLDPKLWRLVWIDGADHSYAVKKVSGRTRKDVEADIEQSLSNLLDAVG